MLQPLFLYKQFKVSNGSPGCIITASMHWPEKHSMKVKAVDFGAKVMTKLWIASHLEDWYTGESFLISLQNLLLQIMALIFSLVLVSKGCHTQVHNLYFLAIPCTVVLTWFEPLLLPSFSPQCLVLTRGELFAVALVLVVDMIIQWHPFSSHHFAFSIRGWNSWPIKMVYKASFPFSLKLTALFFCEGINLFTKS